MIKHLLEIFVRPGDNENISVIVCARHFRRQILYSQRLEVVAVLVSLFGERYHIICCRGKLHFRDVFAFFLGECQYSFKIFLCHSSEQLLNLCSENQSEETHIPLNCM